MLLSTTTKRQPLFSPVSCLFRAGRIPIPSNELTSTSGKRGSARTATHSWPYPASRFSPRLLTARAAALVKADYIENRRIQRDPAPRFEKNELISPNTILIERTNGRNKRSTIARGCRSSIGKRIVKNRDVHWTRRRCRGRREGGEEGDY